MAVYTVHARPGALHAGAADTEAVVLVEERMPWLALLAPPVWLLWHRLWAGLLLYFVVIAVVSAALNALGLGQGLVGLVDMLVSLLFALEATAIRQWTLRRRGYSHVASVVAPNEEAAELKFFSGQTLVVMPAGAANAYTCASPDTGVRPNTGVLGLFPRPMEHGRHQ